LAGRIGRVAPRLDACGRIAADERGSEGDAQRNLRGFGPHVISASMPHHHGLRTAVLSPFAGVLGVVVMAAPSAGCDKDKLNGPEAEVRKTEVKLNLPPVPPFDLPAAP